MKQKHLQLYIYTVIGSSDIPDCMYATGIILIVFTRTYEAEIILTGCKNAAEIITNASMHETKIFPIVRTYRVGR
jgi:hypothetical protein